MNSSARINQHIEVTIAYTVDCEHCEAEYMLSDCIDGKLFKGQDYMHCAVCGGLISLKEMPVVSPLKAVAP